MSPAVLLVTMYHVPTITGSVFTVRGCKCRRRLTEKKPNYEDLLYHLVGV